MAVKRAEEMTSKIMESLEKDKTTRAEKKKNVHSQYKQGELLTVHVPLPKNVSMQGFGTQDAPMEVDDGGDDSFEIDGDDDDEDVPMKDASPSKRSSKGSSASPSRASVKSPRKASLKPKAAPKASSAAIEVDSDDDLTSAVTKKKKKPKKK